MTAEPIVISGPPNSHSPRKSSCANRRPSGRSGRGDLKAVCTTNLSQLPPPRRSNRRMACATTGKAPAHRRPWFRPAPASAPVRAEPYSRIFRSGDLGGMPLGTGRSRCASPHLSRGAARIRSPAIRHHGFGCSVYPAPGALLPKCRSCQRSCAHGQPRDNGTLGHMICPDEWRRCPA
jgi:hypothetical protein